VTKFGVFAPVVAEKFRTAGLPVEELAIAISATTGDKFAMAFMGCYMHVDLLFGDGRAAELKKAARWLKARRFLSDTNFS
jgi:hypothetical protein